MLDGPLLPEFAELDDDRLPLPGACGIPGPGQVLEHAIEQIQQTSPNLRRVRLGLPDVSRYFQLAPHAPHAS